MAQKPRRYVWLTILILGLMAVGMAVRTLSNDDPDRPAGVVAPPAVAGAAASLDEADADTTVSVAVGDRFAVRLRSWAEWRVEAAPDFLRHVETLTGPAEDNDNTGADQWQVLVFKVEAPGEGDLRLTLGRPWIEDDRIRDYRLTVRATAQPGG